MNWPLVSDLSLLGLSSIVIFFCEILILHSSGDNLTLSLELLLAIPLLPPLSLVSLVISVTVGQEVSLFAVL